MLLDEFGNPIPQGDDGQGQDDPNKQKDDGSQDDQDQDQGDGGDQDQEGQDEDPKALVEKLQKENAMLKAKAEKDRMRAKRSYAKADEVKSTYVSKEDVQKMFAEEKEKSQLTSQYPDAAPIMKDIEKLKAERGLSYTEAYALTKGRQMLDPGYRAQVAAGRAVLH